MNLLFESYSGLRLYVLASGVDHVTLTYRQPCDAAFCDLHGDQYRTD